MGFRFRKSIKIAPNVRLNITKNGVSSLSVGKNGARVNVGKKGVRSTVGINGSGLSYSHYQSYKKSDVQADLSLDIRNQLFQIAKQNAIEIYHLYMTDEYYQENIQEQITHISEQLSPLPQHQKDEGLQLYTQQFETWVGFLEKTHQKWIDDGYDEYEFSPEQAMADFEQETNSIMIMWAIGLVVFIMIAFVIYRIFV